MTDPGLHSKGARGFGPSRGAAATIDIASAMPDALVGAHQGVSAAAFLLGTNAHLLEREAAGQIVLKEAATGKSKKRVEAPGPAVGGAAKVASEGEAVATASQTQQVIPRLGPRGVDPIHHNANIMVRDVSGRLRYHDRIVSGNMTAEEEALGFPRNTLASHSEARAIRAIRLERGETMMITGQSPPCPNCKGVMNQAARSTGATIIYRWREDGVRHTWTAGGN
jgi:Pput_2613-like deaminase